MQRTERWSVVTEFWLEETSLEASMPPTPTLLGSSRRLGSVMADLCIRTSTIQRFSCTMSVGGGSLD